MPCTIDCPLGSPPAASTTASRFGRAWQKYAAYPLRLAFAGHADVVHVLDHSFAHLLQYAPKRSFKIVTVHDLAPLVDGSLDPSQARRFRRTLSWLNEADLLMPVSNATATALRSFVTGAPRTVTVPMGVNVEAFEMRRPLPPSVALPEIPRLLSVGSVLGRKNLGVLPAIVARVQAEFGPVMLLRVGERLPAELRRQLESVLSPGHLIEFGFVASEDLVAIYQAANALLMPSTLEGFGLPVIEAMAAGCAVVASNTSSLPEIGGDAAMYFDPADPAAAAAHVVAILRTPALRESLVERGRLRAREFTWQKHAATLVSHYLEALPQPDRHSD